MGFKKFNLKCMMIIKYLTHKPINYPTYNFTLGSPFPIFVDGAS
jgi:hypothetical protein